MGGILGASSAIGARMVMRQPLYARIHAFALQVTAGYWAGYQWNKWCSKKNMSEYKHAVDFAQRHSVIQIRSHVGCPRGNRKYHSITVLIFSVIS